MYKNNFMYSPLTCLIHAVCVIITVYYHPIKSLKPHFNRWFDSKYLFMFYIISSTYHHQNIKKNSINPMGWFPWILCQPECTCACDDGHTHSYMHNQDIHVMDVHTVLCNQSHALTVMHHHACQAMHVHTCICKPATYTRAWREKVRSLVLEQASY